MPRTMSRWLAVGLSAITCAATILIGAEPAAAHDNTSGAIALTLTDQRVLGTAQVAFTELGYRDTTGDGLIGADEMRAQEATVAASLVTTLRDHLTLKVDGRTAAIIGAGPAPAPAAQADDSASEFVEIIFATGPHDGDVSQVDIAWSLTSPTRQVLLFGPDGPTASQLNEEGRASISLGVAATLRSFFVTGVDHVRLGLDHLLFLVVLTFAVVGSAVSRSTTWRVVQLVTAFTLGHATSLCLAYFAFVTIPAQWVEPAISLSIVAAALMALRGNGDAIRPWIAAVVGLVHGLGFASSLGGLGLATTHRISALAAFNVGIDAAQIAVVLLVTGIIWTSGRLLAERSNWVRTAVCASAGLIGLTWTVSRLAF